MALQDGFDLLDESIPGIDCVFASGVLNVTLGKAGTWVINKQTPNKQIWWSSPVSGPLRFEWVEGEWRGTRDGVILRELLEEEVEDATGGKIEVEWDEIGS
ncbi:hypothetical protein TrCOL_g9605 [Triparma columacea]|jgi:frataxin|uniref:Ferroxidase n=1 Tax=Triparma columacea TaxID=722753 RepID=A0A9W7L843_9STRA|nr:hypothetical protein TrCOL_g9605 [Triparma columacea]